MIFQVKPCVVLPKIIDIYLQMCYIIQISWFDNDIFDRKHSILIVPEW